MLVWIVLALGPAQGGDTALTPLIEKLERAQTVRVDFEIGVRGRTVMKGRLLLKGPDKLCLRGEFQSAPLEYYLDGRRCILRSWTSAVPTETAPPVHPGPRARFAVAPLGRALDERVAPGKVENVVDLGL
ncbi:MAG TPA: hypothetical protein VEJ18_13260, partial [Planctomycetota bacterium]|nr:hypothetical protein [Planctomycetota bacterium]